MPFSNTFGVAQMNVSTLWWWQRCTVVVERKGLNCRWPFRLHKEHGAKRWWCKIVVACSVTAHFIDCIIFDICAHFVTFTTAATPKPKPFHCYHSCSPATTVMHVNIFKVTICLCHRNVRAIVVAIDAHQSQGPLCSKRANARFNKHFPTR